MTSPSSIKRAHAYIEHARGSLTLKNDSCDSRLYGTPATGVITREGLR